MIIDGNSILNRSFYGIKLLSTKKGQYTNAIYGFITTLQKLKEETFPDAIAIAFDVPGPTFRKKIFSGYKSNRKGMPDELFSQLPVLKNLLKLLGYNIVECENYEADDILGTLSHSFKKNGHMCIIATGDRDLLQLVSENISVRIASTKYGSPYSTLYNEDVILEKFGVHPSQLIEVKALQGDTSDNIPGVKGIGEKTAQILIKEFGNIDNIYNNIDTIDVKESIRKKLIDGKQSAYMSRELGKICTNAPVDTNIKSYIPSIPDVQEAKSLMIDLEFYSIIDKILPVNSHEIKKMGMNNSKSIKVIDVENSEFLDELFKEIEEEQEAAFNLEILENKIDILCVMHKDKIYLFKNIKDEFLDFAKKVLENEKIKKVFYDIKSIKKNALKIGLNINNIYFDVMLSSYLLNPSSTNYNLERLSQEYKVNISNLDLGNHNYSESEQLIIKNTIFISKLKEVFYKELKENEQLSLLFDIEEPLAQILADMEYRGFKVDKNGLLSYSQILNEKINKIQNEIYKNAGFEFNINSPKQLGMILFENLDLPKGKKNKSGYSTDAKVLEKLRPYHPIINMILEFRVLSKLKSTYCDGMADLVADDGRIHPSFVQTETRTGRISCVEPNLQNIPVRTETGRQLRKYFCAKEGCLLVDADYSQIELRVLAHLSGDKNMIDAFNNNEDIHSLTASKIFNLPINMIGNEARLRAKTVNFGIIYGIGAFSLSQDLKISVAEADKYIKAYLSKYSGVDDYMKTMVSDAKSKGYAETMFKRRRYLPELSSSNFNLRSFGERVARNMPIQGSAADIIKIAMINVSKEIRKRNLTSDIILQVHDELIIESPEKEMDEVRTILKEEMESAIELDVPLTVNISTGRTWYDSKG